MSHKFEPHSCADTFFKLHRWLWLLLVLAAVGCWPVEAVCHVWGVRTLGWFTGDDVVAGRSQFEIDDRERLETP